MQPPLRLATQQRPAYLPIQRSAHSAFFFTAGMVSIALKRWCFSTGSLMYDSSSSEYISASTREGRGTRAAVSRLGAPALASARTGVDVLDGDLEAVEAARLCALHLGAKVHGEVLVDNAVAGCKKGQHVLDKMPLSILCVCGGGGGEVR